MSEQTSMSFDRMRSMLNRAAEIRDSEQQQVFNSLDEILARLATLDALGSMRKRLTELPDRTEMSVLAERMDATVTKLDAQDASVTSVVRSMDALVDRLAKPFAQLDGRLDGMAGRMEGVCGRMEGLDDKLGGLHKRLDDLDNRLNRHELRLDGMPGAIVGSVRERVAGVETAIRDRLDEVEAGERHQRDVTHQELRKSFGESHDNVRTQLDAVAARLDALAGRLDDVTARLDVMDSAMGARPDTNSLTALVTRANHESELRSAGQLDEAMATFAEIILGGGPGGDATQTSMPAARPVQRRTRAKVAAASVPATGDAADTDTEAEED